MKIRKNDGAAPPKANRVVGFLFSEKEPGPVVDKALSHVHKSDGKKQKSYERALKRRESATRG